MNRETTERTAQKEETAERSSGSEDVLLQMVRDGGVTYFSGPFLQRREEARSLIMTHHVFRP